MQIFWRSFVVLFLSEMGDKTQVVSFALGTQYNLSIVLTGIFLAVAALMGCSVAAGTVASRLLPTFWIDITSAIIFIAFGLWALRKPSAAADEEDEEKSVGKKFGPLIAVMATFFLAELGDKTIFASLAMGGREQQFFPVWLGSTFGMYLADVVAIVAGRVLGKRLPAELIRYGSAAVFLGAGIYTIIDAFHRH